MTPNRIVMRSEDGGWREVPFMALKAGDTFRLKEPECMDFHLVGEFIAASNPFFNQGGVPTIATVEGGGTNWRHG